MKILVTGGAGYIGSSICFALSDAGHEPVVLDSFFSGKREFVSSFKLYEGDIADVTLVKRVFNEHPDLAGVIHCAARIVIPESVDMPHIYYEENFVKSKILFDTLSELNCGFLMISSTASLYKVPENFCVTEESDLNPLNPYARSKLMMEWLAQDYARAGLLRCIALRYFNPVGADPKMRCGLQLPYPTHILGALVMVTQGKKDVFEVTGTEYPTRDGTGLRDYIHVWDLAKAHVRVAENTAQLFNHEGACQSKNYVVLNVGRGAGITVKEFLDTYQKVSGKAIPFRLASPRVGDIAGAYANVKKIGTTLNWQAGLTIEEGIRHALEWAQKRESILGY